MSETPRHLPVVVGVDDEPRTRVALEWAIDEATRRRLPLHILHANTHGQGSQPSASPVEAEVSSLAVVAQAVARAHDLTPWLDVISERSTSKPSLALVDASRWAACVIVGARGRRPLVGALLGTTSAEVAARAACPVVVVRQLPEIESRRPGVVVGADGSRGSVQALGYAFAQAADRELPLTVVHVWSPGVNRAHLAPAFTTELSTIATAEQALAAQEIAGWAEKYPDVLVKRHVRRGHPVKALVEESHGAELLVVGSRGRGGLAGMLLGSVSQGVLQHAHCPVAVVRSPRS